MRRLGHCESCEGLNKRCENCWHAITIVIRLLIVDRRDKVMRSRVVTSSIPSLSPSLSLLLLHPPSSHLSFECKVHPHWLSLSLSQTPSVTLPQWQTVSGSSKEWRRSPMVSFLSTIYLEREDRHLPSSPRELDRISGIFRMKLPRLWLVDPGETLDEMVVIPGSRSS